MDIDESNGNSSNDYCEHSHVDGKVLTTAIAAAGVIIGVVFLVVVLACVRAYKSYLQRIYIFLVFSIVTEDTLRLLGSLFNNSTARELLLACEVLGFLTLLFHWSTYMQCLVWQLYVLTTVCTQAVHEPTFVTKVKASKKLQIVLEVAIITLTFIGPATCSLVDPSI